jgi:hypothetical protein
MSSYESHLPCGLQIKHRSILSHTANNEAIEKIYTNNIKPLGKKRMITIFLK